MEKENKNKMSSLVKPRRLQVWQSYACLVVDGATGEGDNEYLKKDSKMFCGCCGAMVGKLKTNYSFPLSYNGLKSRLEDIRISGKNNVRCDSCKQVLFPDCIKLVLTRLDNFLELQRTHISEAVVQQFQDQPEKLAAIKKEIEKSGSVETEDVKVVSINSRKKGKK